MFSFYWLNIGRFSFFSPFADAIARFEFVPQVSMTQSSHFPIADIFNSFDRFRSPFFYTLVSMTFLLQLFAVLFFFMLFVLGIGSNIAMCSCITTAILDQWPKWKPSIVVIAVAFVGFLIGLLYITPVGSKWMLTLFLVGVKEYFFFLNFYLIFFIFFFLYAFQFF